MHIEQNGPGFRMPLVITMAIRWYKSSYVLAVCNIQCLIQTADKSVPKASFLFECGYFFYIF